MIGSGSSGTWNYTINTEEEMPGGIYGETIPIGNYPLFGPDDFLQAFSITVADAEDANCATTFTYLPPAPTEDCACNVQLAYELSAVIYNNGTFEDCDDDFSELTFTDLSTDISGGYEILLDNTEVFTGEFGDAGGTIQVPVDGNPHRITMRSLDDFGCLAVYDLPVIPSACPLVPVEFFFNDQNTCGQTNFCIPIQANNFDNILGMQFSVNYDPVVLTFTGSTNFNPEMIGWTTASIGNPNPGNLTITWNDPFAYGVSIAADEPLAELCFDILAGGSEYATTLNYSSSPTPTEVVNGFVEELPVLQDNADIFCGCAANLSFAQGPVNDNGTPEECGDDFYVLTYLVNFVNAPSPFYQLLIDGQIVVIEGTAGTGGTINVPADGNIHIITCRNLADTGCNATDQLLPVIAVGCEPEPCIALLSEEIFTDDNGTPTDPTDDFFLINVTLTENGGGSSAGWVAMDAFGANYSGSYDVPTIFGPYACSMPEELSFSVLDLQNFTCTTTLTFNNPLFGCGSTPVVLSFPDVEACQSDAFCLPLTVENFDNILGFQFSVNYDPMALEYMGATAFNPNLIGFTAANIGNWGDGRLTVNWNDPFAIGESLVAGDTLVSFCFNFLGNEGVPTEVIVSDDPTPIEIINGDEVELSVFTNSAIITCECSVSAGTIDFVGDDLCNDQTLAWTYNADAELLPDYLLGVALYAEADDLPSQYLAFTTGATIDRPAAAEPNRTYYLRTLAGPDAGNGEIDFTADCIRRGNSELVRWNEIIIEDCSAPVLTCLSPSALLNCTVSGGTGNLSYAWTVDGLVFADIPNVTVNQPGVYLLTVTDENGCTAEQEITVLADLVAPDLTISLVGNLCVDGEVILTGNTDLPITSFVWSNGEVGESITVNTPGEYSITVSNVENGCINIATVVVDPAVEECNTIQGTAYRSDDCLTDSEPLADWLVEVSGDNYLQYQYTNELGQYEIFVPQGTFDVRLLPVSPAWEACEADGYELFFADNGEAQSQDLRALPLSDCPLLEVSMNVGILRPCFNNGILTVAYENVGTQPLLDEGLIAVVLPAELTYAASSGTYLGSNGDTLFFAPLQPLLPGGAAQFNIFVNVSCDAVPGSTLCVKALGLPYGPCPAATSAWSGGSLQILGECTAEEVLFTLRNIGDGTLSTGSSYIVIQDGVMLWEVPEDVPPLLPGESTTVSLPANGFTYQLEAEQEPFHPGFSNPMVSIEGCGENEDGTFSTGFVIQLPNDEEDIYIDEDCRVVTASYDPNDKQAEPLGYATEHYIEPERSLEYTIRFQNTGTDTAFTVIIRDTLSDWLDMTTLHPGVSSHPYRLELDTARAMSFIFNDILLPDSTTNFDASQGFVEFKVRPLPETPLGTRIENTAAIYFDFNAPIITNTVYHTLGLDFLEVLNWVSETTDSTKWRVFPNPNAGQLNLTWEPATERALLLITDGLGRPCGSFPLSGGTAILEVQFLAPGWYSLQLIGEDGTLLGSGKLVRR
jgi:hypothetical protein